MSNKTVGTFLNYNELPEDLKEKLEKGAVKMAPTFKSRYMLVYGTLRFLMGNWRNYLQGKTIHRGTFEMVGFLKSSSISCQYTGNPKHVTVMDVFEIYDEFLDDVNESVDGLEGVHYGYYESMAVKVQTEEGPVVAKFYQLEWAKNPDVVEKSEQEDYAGFAYKNIVDREGGTKGLFQAMGNDAPRALKFYKSKF